MTHIPNEHEPLLTSLSFPVNTNPSWPPCVHTWCRRHLMTCVFPMSNEHNHLLSPCVHAWSRHFTIPIPSVLLIPMCSYLISWCKPGESVVQSKNTHSKARVKHNQAWSPNRWVTVMCWASCPPWDFSGVKFCADCESPLDETKLRCPRVYNYKHAKRLHTQEEFRNVYFIICLWPGFDCPEVTLYGWQDIKIQLLL